MLILGAISLILDVELSHLRQADAPHAHGRQRLPSVHRLLQVSFEPLVPPSFTASLELPSCQSHVARLSLSTYRRHRAKVGKLVCVKKGRDCPSFGREY